MQRNRSDIAQVVCLVLSYMLMVSLFSPFSGAAKLTAKQPSSPQEPVAYREGEILVRFRPGTSKQQKETILGLHDARIKKQLRGESGFEKVEVAQGRDARTATLELLLNPQVEFAEPNFLISKDDLTPNDPRFNEQWALRNTGQSGGQHGSDVNATSAWTTTTGSQSTVIAVIDSGIDFSHLDLANNQWTNLASSLGGDRHGWDYVDDSAEIKDEQGHGTAIAGIIAAEGNNSVGISGVMWRASLMSLRVLDNTGTGDVADAVEAIDYAIINGAQVINLSWGTPAESLALKDAIQRALKRSVVVVSSAGNAGKDLTVTPYYPSSFALDGLIAVAASDNSDQLASWSNFGTGPIAVAAPGTNLLTTRMGGGYWNVTGTSAAAAVVSGIAGLLKTVRRSANPQMISKAISEGVRRNASLSGKVSSGGVVNAAGALATLHGQGNQSPFVPPGYAGGGNGQGSIFRTTPPPPITSAPISNLPNLDHARNAPPEQPSARIPIESNVMCADCDPVGGGGGGGYYPPSDPNFSTARRRPANETGQPGVDLGSRNFNWSLPLVSLPGRAGLDLNITLTYNSLVWTRDGSYMKFNADFGTPAPGFRLGLPVLQQRFLNAQTNIYAYLMITPSGRRVELRQIGTSNIYESADSNYTQLDASNTNALLVRTTDGTQFTFEPVNVNGEYRCTKIKDRNGNYISATYNATTGHVQTITDTLERVITFVYNGDNNLQAIRQSWAGVNHDWATFSYTQVFVAPAFGGSLLVNGPSNQNVPVLSQVSLHDGTYFTFQYNTAFAQVNRINHYAADGHLLNYTSYNMNSNSGQTECPRFTQRGDWAENWNGNAEAVTSYSVAADGSSAQQTTPDGTIYKEFFATSGWQKGLTTGTEIWFGGVKKKWTSVSWTQDNTSLTYLKNPRTVETNVSDEAGNLRRKTIDYGQYVTYGLPYLIREYAADGTTEIKQVFFDYNLSQTYLDRRIIGLVSEMHLTNVSNWQGKVTYTYDDPARLQAVPAAARQHDTNYNTSFTARGNVTSVSRWDVTDITNPAKKLTSYTNYYTTGTPIATIDPAGHQSTIAYADAFSDSVNRNTFAYPTSVTDHDNFSSTAQHNYDFGAVTRIQDPKGAVQTTSYDSAGRPDQTTNQTSGAYVRNVYHASGFIQSYSTIQNGAGEAYSITYFDGAGRVRAEGGDLPGSVGGYVGRLIFYDVMGRTSQVTNPAEMNASWVPSGDDAAGWNSTLYSYDWRGRPRVTTNPDGSTREKTYGGCGCAGGEVCTERDENGRRKRYTKDVFGRLVKVEELNWNETVYSTTNYTLNVRDQITNIDQAGQTRSFAYDGYGRLVTRTTPEQGTTNYSYFADDTRQTVTDARGATTTFAYNGRHLVTNITYGVPGGVAATANVTFAYDSAGNRTSMTDGLGSVSYVYNTLSQLTSETRTFTGVGSYQLSYGYNLAGQVNSITNHWGAQVGYGYDKLGRMTNVSGAGFAGVSSYVNSIAYRAFGLKQVGYNNDHTLSLQYDNRTRTTLWSIPGVLRMQYEYLWEQSGRIDFARNLDDETLDRWFAYDHVGRLVISRSGNEARLAIGEQVPLLYNGPYSHGYQYDQFGNITFREGWGGTNPQYSAAYTNNKMNAFVYDASGNLTDAGGGWTFTYDGTGQQATSAVNNVQMFYDGDGLRGKKSENGVVTLYLRSSVLGGSVVAEMNSGGGWSRGYVYMGGQILAVQQGSVYWVHQDPVAKSKRLTDGAGNVVSTIELDPWGGETNRSSNDAFQPRKFTTYERDSIGSDDAMHRRYNRWWSRFEQPDPYDGSYNLTNPQSFNRYSYVNNDPVNFIDPSGLDGVVSEIGPGTSIVNVPINEGVTDTIGDGGEVIMVLPPLGRVLNPLVPQNPSDTGEVETLLTESCVHFLNGILAELGKIRDPYSYNFLGIFKPAKDRGSFDTVRLTAEQKKEGLGGTYSTISDPAFNIFLDAGLFNRGDFTAGYVMIHELFHGASASRTGYNHTEMAQAAYNVALSIPAIANKLKNYGNSGPPRKVDYSPGGNFVKADDWYNAGVFDAVVRIGCPIPSK